MQVSIIRQTPAASILLMLLMVVATFVRFALAPYGDELVAGEVAMLGAKVDAFQSVAPVWGWIVSALVVVLIAVSLGRMTSAFGLYHVRTTISIPLYVLVACGVFIAPDSLAVSLSAFFALRMMRRLCGGYVRGTDLNYAFYAGMCAALAPMFYAPALVLVLMLPIAVLMFGFSWREIVVMTVGAVLPVAALCYVGWLCGGEFLLPIKEFIAAFTYSTNYTLWGTESVVALTLLGVVLFVVVCGVAAYFGDKRSVAVRPRTIMAFHIVAFIISCVAFVVPSATAGVLMLVALPAAIIIPVALVRMRDGLCNLVIVALLVLAIIHFFVA